MVNASRSPCLTPEEMLCFDVYALNHGFARIYKPLLAPLGLTYPQYLVMTVLWDMSPMAVGRIGRRVGLESSTLTPLLKRLEAQGYLTRTRAKDDERRVEVALTAPGRDLAARAATISGCVERATGLDEAGIQDLRGRLQALRDALSRHDPHAHETAQTSPEFVHQDRGTKD